MIGLSRRITRPDGSFGGVALATIELSFLRALISTPQLGNESTISLVREDGVVIARRSTAAKKPAENVAHSAAFRRIVSQPAGQFVGTSAIDGVQRLYTFSRVGTTPLVLTVALSTDEIYAQWAEKAAWMAAVLFAATSVIVALTMLLARQLGERARAEDRLTAANAELAHLSITDALTGLGNRRRFDEVLGREMRRAKRSGAPASLVLLDLDHFKPLNDRLGHQQGDQTLQAVARVLADSCAAIGASAFRVGGEEFALLLPGLGDATGLAFADSVRGRIMALGRLNPASPTGLVTASFGVAEIGDDDPPAAYARADAALYQAKRDGRNRCAVNKPLVAAA